MADQPRYSYGTEQDNGSAWLFVVLPVLSMLGGFFAYRCPRAVALALGLPGLVLSPFTTPRGDNDGLWVLIVPMMCALLFCDGCVGDARCGLQGEDAVRTPAAATALVAMRTARPVGGNRAPHATGRGRQVLLPTRRQETPDGPRV